MLLPKLQQKGFIHLLPVLLLAVLVVGLIAVVSQVRTKQDVRSRAAEPPQANLSLSTTNLLKASQAVQNAPAAQRSAALQTLTSLVAQRKQLFLSTVDKNPEEVLKTVLPETVTATFPQEAQAGLEKQTTVEGNLRVTHGDDFKNKTEVNLYVLTDAAGSHYTLHFARKVPRFTSAKIKVTGVQIGDAIVIDGLDENSVKQTSQPQASDQTKTVLGTQTTKVVAVFLINFQTWRKILALT